ncbi:MAG: alpha/beta hydrolase fold domain-containing protein [Bacteroidales bacterium]|nr:alpha/beta hydrolase fold domain-containing protein [Bacteroidales bacterium]
MSPGKAFTERYLKMMFASLRDATPEQIQEELEHCRNINRKPVRVPKIHRAHFSESQFVASNGYPMQVFSTVPWNDLDRVIVYIHGGACIYQPVFFHWRFVHDLALRTHCQVLMPIYPKYPDYHCVDNMAVMMDYYERVISPMQAKKVVLMGDSFGGNVAMSMTQEIAKRGLKPVTGLVLMSPCVDNAFTQRDKMLALQPLDVMIKLERIETIMGGWQGELPPTHPWVSPVYGNLSAFPDDTLLIYGSDEILKADAELLTNRMNELGRPIRSLEYQGMFHTFPLFPVREGFDAIQQITKLVLS